jgi:hypothetical protein
MNKLIISLSILVCLVLFSFCSGKTNSPVSEGNTDSIPQLTGESKNENATKKEAADFSIELNDKEPASNGGQIILTIKGGVPFSDLEKPFKIESINKSSSSPGLIYLNKFEKKAEGVYVVNITTSGDAEESKQELVVTDAEGNERRENYTMYYYP